MPNSIEPTPAEEATPTAPTAPEAVQAPEPMTSDEASAAIDGLEDAESLGAALFGGDPPLAETPPTKTQTTEEDPGEGPEEEPQLEPQPEPEPEPEQEEEPSGPSRLSLKALSSEERIIVAEAVSLVREGKAESMKDALAVLMPSPASPETPPDPSEPEETPTPSWTDVLDDDTKTFIEEFKDATPEDIRRAKFEQLKAADEASQIFDRPAEMTAMKRIAALEELKDEMRTAEMATREKTAAFESDVAETIESVKEIYPESADPESYFSQRLLEAFELAEAREDPVLGRPDYFMVLADAVNDEIKGLREQFGSGTQQPTQQAVPDRPKPRVMGQVASAAGPNGRVTRDQAEAAIEAATEEELEMAMFGE